MENKFWFFLHIYLDIISSWAKILYKKIQCSIVFYQQRVKRVVVTYMYNLWSVVANLNFIMQKLTFSSSHNQISQFLYAVTFLVKDT